jgi:cytochrome c-type biogenesis protein
MPEVGGVGLFVAFAAGLLSCASPCVLPLVPAYLGYLTGAASPAVPASGPGAVAAVGVSQRATPSPFFHALSFVSGFSLVFVILGTSIGVVGFLLRDHEDVLAKAAGVLLIILGLHLSRVITIPFLEEERRWQYTPTRRLGYARSFLVGSAFSVGWTPCVGPTLGAILALAATSSTVWQGGLLLVIYSFGLAIPFLAMGLAFNATRGVFERIRPFMGVVNLLSGILLIIVGILIFTERLIDLNQFFQVDFFDFSSDT